MTTIIDSITRASRHHDRTIKHAIAPFTELGIRNMAMQRVTKDGYWSIVTSNPGWMEYSSAYEFYRCDPTLVNPGHYDSGISFLPAHQNEAFQNTLLWHAETYYDLGNCLAIVEKIEGDAWCTFLTASVMNTKIINTYISRFHHIKDAIRHFRLNNTQLFNYAFDHSLDLKEINKATYDSSDNIVLTEPFHDSANNQKQIKLYEQLTPREKEIMNHFLQGKTAKETSKLINLTHRTIEFYFNNIKKKLGCNHKRELLLLFST